MLHIPRREWPYGPAVETLEKLARALEVPLYQLFYDGEKPPQLLKRKTSDDIVWGSSSKHAVYLNKLRRCLSKTPERDRKILLSFAQKVAAGRSRHMQASRAHACEEIQLQIRQDKNV
jgi:hypothetical protein